MQLSVWPYTQYRKLQYKRCNNKKAAGMNRSGFFNYMGWGLGSSHLFFACAAKAKQARERTAEQRQSGRKRNLGSIDT
jgi:hypothetical protein